MTDFYEWAKITGEGCCLLCSNASPGCLCPECNCTKCSWHRPRYGQRPCTKVDVLKEEGREKWTIDFFSSLCDGTAVDVDKLRRGKNKSLKKWTENEK